MISDRLARSNAKEDTHWVRNEERPTSTLNSRRFRFEYKTTLTILTCGVVKRKKGGNWNPLKYFIFRKSVDIRGLQLLSCCKCVFNSYCKINFMQKMPSAHLQLRSTLCFCFEGAIIIQPLLEGNRQWHLKSVQSLILFEERLYYKLKSMLTALTAFPLRSSCIKIALAKLWQKQSGRQQFKAIRRHLLQRLLPQM